MMQEHLDHMNQVNKYQALAHLVGEIGLLKNVLIYQCLNLS